MLYAIDMGQIIIGAIILHVATILPNLNIILACLSTYLLVMLTILILCVIIIAGDFNQLNSTID